MSAADSLSDSIGNTKPSQPGLNVNGEPSGTDAEKPPLLEDVMQLARLGDVEPMRRLLDDGRFRADHKDHEGITPLHVCLSLFVHPEATSMTDETVGCYK